MEHGAPGVFPDADVEVPPGRMLSAAIAGPVERQPCLAGGAARR